MAPAAVMPYDSHREIAELLVITSSAEINGSLFTDAIVQKDCSVHVRGSVTGSLTIEPGADVLVDGWRVSLSRNRAFVIGPARHRRHRLARRQSCMER